jgi:signal transduction histidine kinase
MDEKRQSFIVEIEPDLPKVFTDPNRLMQVLTNLVSNAWKYTPSDGEIRLRATKQGDFVRIEVIDNGFGISLEDQGKIFSQFFRSEDANVRSEHGWGLGLNVTQQLVELMGGKIGFESASGKGATFWVLLPTTQA